MAFEIQQPSNEMMGIQTITTHATISVSLHTVAMAFRKAQTATANMSSAMMAIRITMTHARTTAFQTSAGMDTRIRVPNNAMMATSTIMMAATRSACLSSAVMV